MAEIAHSQRLLRVRLVCRGCTFRPFSHANSPRLSLVCVYAWRFWPIVSAFVFSQRQLSLSASMHNTLEALCEFAERTARFANPCRDLVVNQCVLLYRAAQVCELVSDLQWVVVDGDGWSCVFCSWLWLINHLCFLQTDRQSETACGSGESVGNSLNVVDRVCEKCTVVSVKKISDQHLGSSCFWVEPSKVKYISISSEPNEWS